MPECSVKVNGMIFNSNVRIQAEPLLQVPVFVRRGSVEVSYHEFAILSAIVHLGEHAAGHYRAATRYWDFPYGWRRAIHEDNTMATLVDDFPTWFEENAVMFF